MKEPTIKPRGPVSRQVHKRQRLRHGCRVTGAVEYKEPRDWTGEQDLVGQIVEVEIKTGLIIPCVVLSFKKNGRSFRVAPIWGRGDFGIRREKIVSILSEETLLSRYQREV